MSYSNTADWTLCHGTTSGPGRNRNVLLSASWPKETNIFRICLKGPLLSLPLLSAAMLISQSLSLAWSSFSHTTCLLDIDFPSAEILSCWVGAELSCLFYPGDRNSLSDTQNFQSFSFVAFSWLGSREDSPTCLTEFSFFHHSHSMWCWCCISSTLCFLIFSVLLLSGVSQLPQSRTTTNKASSTVTQPSGCSQPAPSLLYYHYFSEADAGAWQCLLDRHQQQKKPIQLLQQRTPEKGMCRHSSRPDKAGPKHWFSEEKHSVLISLTTFIL